MAKGKTWYDVVDALNNDTSVEEFMNDVSRAAELGPRAPAELYIKTLNDAGEDGLACLPYPNSDQEDKTDSHGQTVGDNLQRLWHDTKRWDYYSYKTQSGELIEGSRFTDMADRTSAGKVIASSLNTIKVWSDPEKYETEGAAETIYIDGQAYNVRKMFSKERDNLRSMLNSRRNRIANVLRGMASLYFTKQDIETRMKTAAEVSFVYVEDENPASGIRSVTKCVKVMGLISDKQSPKYGQRAGTAEVMTVRRFLNLNVDQAIAAGGTFQHLIESKRTSNQTKAGQSKAEKDSSLVTSANFAPVMDHIRVFVEDDEDWHGWVKGFDKLPAEEQDMAIQDIGIVLYRFSDFFSKPIRDRFNVLQKADADKAKAERDAKVQQRNGEQSKPSQTEKANAASASFGDTSKPAAKPQSESPTKTTRSTGSRRATR